MLANRPPVELPKGEGEVVPNGDELVKLDPKGLDAVLPKRFEPKAGWLAGCPKLSPVLGDCPKGCAAPVCPKAGVLLGKLKDEELAPKGDGLDDPKGCDWPNRPPVCPKAGVDAAVPKAGVELPNEDPNPVDPNAACVCPNAGVDEPNADEVCPNAGVWPKVLPPKGELPCPKAGVAGLPKRPVEVLPPKVEVWPKPPAPKAGADA